ncbi:hypothetical protein ACFL3Q_03520 [Planctomycetota bacterium]
MKYRLKFTFAVLLCLDGILLAGGLVNVIPDDTPQLSKDIVTFKKIQDKAFKSYADAYAGYKTDIEDLALKRRKILNKLKDPQVRKQMAEDGTLKTYYLKTWENLLLSVGHQVARIDALLNLKYLRKDLLFRVANDFQRQAVENEKEITKIKTSIVAKQADLKRAEGEARKLLKSKKGDDYKKQVLAQKIKQLRNFVEQKKALIGRLERNMKGNINSASILKSKAGERLGKIYSQLENKRGELYQKLQDLEIDINNFNSIEMDMLVQSFKKEETELHLVSDALDGFDNDYREMIEIDSAIWDMHSAAAVELEEHSASSPNINNELEELLRP